MGCMAILERTEEREGLVLLLLTVLIKYLILRERDYMERGDRKVYIEPSFKGEVKSCYVLETTGYCIRLGYTDRW